MFSRKASSGVKIIFPLFLIFTCEGNVFWSTLFSLVVAISFLLSPSLSLFELQRGQGEGEKAGDEAKWNFLPIEGSCFREFRSYGITLALQSPVCTGRKYEQLWKKCPIKIFSRSKISSDLLFSSSHRPLRASFFLMFIEIAAVASVGVEAEYLLLAFNIQTVNIQYSNINIQYSNLNTKYLNLNIQ